MTRGEFEDLLTATADQLTQEAQDAPFASSKDFENRVRQVLESLGEQHGVIIDYEPHPYSFPDIGVGPFGVEVKYTSGDSWRSVGNSILETHRTSDVESIYVMYGKMGGTPEVRWGDYAQSVMHVRTSHVPRFELEIGAVTSLFDKMGVTYDDFSILPIEQKMHYIRQYARSRVSEGEQLWWLEERPEQEHSVPIAARLYTSLTTPEKRRLRAEATLLFPEIVSSSRSRNKYNKVVLYLLTYRGVLCHQARDLFSAGSVAGAERGGNYLARALKNIEAEIIQAAAELDDALIVEYWGVSVPPESRIARWLLRADEYARDWKPSAILFRGDGGDEEVSGDLMLEFEGE